MQYHVPLWGIQWRCIFAFSQGIPIIYSVCRKIICQFRLSSLGRKVKFSCSRPGLFSLSLLHPILHFNAQAFLPLGLGFLGTEKHPCTLTPASASASVSASSNLQALCLALHRSTPILTLPLFRLFLFGHTMFGLLSFGIDPFGQLFPFGLLFNLCMCWTPSSQ